MVARGAEISAKGKSGITWFADCEPDLKWLVRIAVPFDFAFSKNRVWTMSPKGHVFLRREADIARQHLAFSLRSALAGQLVVQAKLWVDILVQKPNHKGDAINVVDVVCDAIKDATGLDDRWFCIRRLDWEIVKVEPKLYVGIGQEVEEDHRACSYCGRILPLHCFVSSDRACYDCRTSPRKRRRLIVLEGGTQPTLLPGGEGDKDD
jgi:hypothetical protein